MNFVVRSIIAASMENGPDCNMLKRDLLNGMETPGFASPLP
jgi:hypothetical protein